MKTRREALRLLTLAGSSAAAFRSRLFAQTSAPLFHARTIDHIAITTSDPHRTAAFYHHVFGTSGLRPLDGGGYALDFNNHFIRLDVRPKGGQITQFCIAVDGFDARRDAASVRAAGFNVLSASNDYIDVSDPDNVKVRIAATGYAATCAACPPVTEAALTKADESPLFRARTLNHINFRVGSLRRSVEFYNRLFGLPRTLRGILPASERIYALDFNECYISITEGLASSTRASGPQVFIEQVGELSHFCIGVQEFDSEKLRGTGMAVRGLVSQGVRANTVYVADPDGISVQISAEDWKSLCPNCAPAPLY